MGLEFEVCPSGGEEIITKEIPSEVVMELAKQKAAAVGEELLKQKGNLTSVHRPEGENDSAEKAETVESILVIGADTIVVNDEKILGKPHDAEDACRMLRSLSGKTHQVYTGVCLLLIGGEKTDMADGKCRDSGVLKKEVLFSEKTDVTFYPMTEEEICEYVGTGDPLDKAGAYGIQGICGKYIKGIEGDYNNVVGLPIARLYQEMKPLYSCR
ncbi:MAG: Maf family protein [Clostridiales bacterium]|nr:Maf family protein [Clostridiales bacterium]